MASGNALRLIKRVFDKNLRGFMIDNMSVKCEIGLYDRVEEKVSIIG